jgi:hypothetical protein
MSALNLYGVTRPHQPAVANGLDLRGNVRLDLRAAGSKRAARVPFSCVAYTGQPFSRPHVLQEYGAPVVVRLRGINVGNGALPILYGHAGPALGRSRTVTISKGCRLVVRGFLDRENRIAREVIVKAREGTAWEASLGITCKPGDLEYFRSRNGIYWVNRRAYNAPLCLWVRCTLHEVSIVARGLDGGTSVSLIGGLT